MRKLESAKCCFIQTILHLGAKSANRISLHLIRSWELWMQPNAVSVDSVLVNYTISIVVLNTLTQEYAFTALADGKATSRQIQFALLIVIWSQISFEKWITTQKSH